MDASGYSPIGYLVMNSFGCGGPYILRISHAADHRHHACELAGLLDNPAKVALTDSSVFAVSDPRSVHYACGDSPHAGDPFAAGLAFYQTCKQFPIIHIFHLNNNLFLTGGFVAGRITKNPVLPDKVSSVRYYRKKMQETAIFPTYRDAKRGSAACSAFYSGRGFCTQTGLDAKRQKPNAY